MERFRSSHFLNQFYGGQTTLPHLFNFLKVLIISLFLYSCGRAGNKALDPNGLEIGGKNISNPTTILCYTGQPCSQDLILRAVSEGDGLPGLQVSFVEQTNSGLNIDSPITTTDLNGYARSRIVAPLFSFEEAIVFGTVDGYAEPTPFIINVKPGAHHFELTQGNNQFSVVNQNVPIKPMVRVVDIVGTPVPGWDVMVTVTSGNGSVSQTNLKSNASGFVSIDWTLGTTVGTNTILFSTPIIFGTPSTMSFTATGTPDTPHNFLLEGASSFVAGTCNAYTVYSRDQFNNLSPALSNITVNVTGAGNGTFYSDSSCMSGNEITSTTISTGNSSQVFYYRNTMKESVTLNVDDTGTLIASTLDVSVQSDISDHIVIFSGSGQSAVVNTNLAIAPVVQVQDQFNNPVEGETVSFTVSNGGGSVSPSSATSDSDGKVSFTHTMGTTVGINSVTAIADNAVGVPTSVIISQTAISDVPHNILFTGPTIITAGVCSGPYTLTSRDQFNNNTNAILI